MQALIHSVPPILQQATTDPRLHQTPGHSRACLSQSLVGSLLLSPGFWCTRLCLCSPRVFPPVLCKFWQLCGWVNGDLLQEHLCRTHTQSPCPCGRPLPTHTSTGDTQTQFFLSLCGVPGSWCAQGLFEPSDHLWREWGLILNAYLPLLPSCWGFSFALGRGVSPHSRSSTYWNFSDLGHGVSPHDRSSKAQVLLLTFDVGYLSLLQHCAAEGIPYVQGLEQSGDTPRPVYSILH